MSDVSRAQVLEKLKEVYDPEIPVNVVDLGLIYNIDVSDNNIHVLMTLTAPGCGMGPYICLLYTSDAADDLPLCRSRWSPYL